MSAKSWLTGPSRLAAVIRELPEGLVAVDRDATILWANPASEGMIGYSAAELVGRNGLELIDPADLDTAAAALQRTFESPGAKQPWSLRVVGSDGESRWVEMAPKNLLDYPTIGAVLISVRSLDERNAAVLEARTIEELFRRAFDDAPIGMALVAADGRLARVNSTLCELVHRSPLELLGMDTADLTHPGDLAWERELIGQLVAGDRRTYELDKRLLLPDGSSVWVCVGVSLVRSSDGEPERFVVHVQDISDRKASEAELAHRATHDPLTGLANRALFEDRLEVAVLRSERLPTSVAVLFCDLDGFKVVNDELGHDAGDVVLAEVAARLRQAVRPGDTVARFGGDEFVVLCEDLVSDRDLDAICSRMARAVGRPIEVGEGHVTIGLSIGRAMSSGIESPAELMRLADDAMYEVKGR